MIRVLSALLPLLAMATPAQSNPLRDSLNQRVGTIDSELSEASRAIGTAESEVNSADASIGGLSGRLSTVRGHGYAAMAHLDKTTNLLTTKWAEVGPSLKQSVSSNLQPLRQQVNAAESQAQRLRQEINSGNFIMAEAQVNGLASEASSLKSRALTDSARVTAPLKELSSSLAAVDRDLKIAETTVALFSQAAFPMQQAESPVLAIEGRMMEGEKQHGTLYFTNHRFVFEGQKEVVLEKHLFIVTKKRIDRVVTMERPVGAVQSISKGRVGLIAGIGVYVQFKPEVGVPVTPFDVKGWEADVITRFFKYITGGEADRDIASTHGVAAPAAATIKLVRCPACGAPHSGEVYQGQTSLACEYCGSAMALA
jgi:hypothetical protein